MKRAITALLSAAVLLGVSTPSSDAEAQTWLEDRRYREGMGIRFGNFELHPGIGAGIGYDSNYFHRAEADIGGSPVGSMRFQVSPSISLATLGKERRADGPAPSIGFRTELMATYNEFIPVSGSDFDKERLQEQRDVSGTFNVGLQILPGRTWSGSIDASLARSIRPTQNGSVTGDSSFNRWLPKGAATLTWRPGSGLLDWNLGYAFQGRLFEEQSLRGLDNQSHSITTRGRWKFYPRTALMYDASFGFMTYPNSGAGVTFKQGSNPLRTRMGLNGLVTPSFSVTAIAGWGASFYDTGQNFDSVIGELELKWYLGAPGPGNPLASSGAFSAVSAGFQRDFQDAYFGTFSEVDRGFVNFSYLFGGAFLMSLEAGAAAVIFPAQQVVADVEYNKPGGWTDARVDAKLFGEYRFKNYLGLNAEVGFDGYFSETTVTYTDETTLTKFTDPIAYKQVTASVGFRWFM